MLQMPDRFNMSAPIFTMPRVANLGGRRTGRARNCTRHEGKPVGLQRLEPGPTIEVVEGDRVRIFVTNKRPEHTSIHWHGRRLPIGMDGVTGLTSQASNQAKPSSTSSSQSGVTVLEAQVILMVSSVV